MSIECGFVFLDDGVMAVNPHRAMIMQDRKGKDLSVKLLLVLHSFVELDDTSHGQSHTVSVLSICDVKCCGTALHFACKEGKIHSVGCNKKEGLINATDEQIDLFELLVSKCKLSESNRVIRLRLETLRWYAAHSAFVDTFNQIIKICGAVGHKGFRRRDN